MKNQVDLLLAPYAYENVEPAYWSDRVAVVIDVLRATSTIVTALAEGYKWVLPCLGVAEAKDLALVWPNALLAGERGGVAPKNFHKGNSPQEFLHSRAQDQGIILTTTNGTRAIQSAQGCSELLISSFLNLQATADYLKNESRPITLVGSGTGENFSLEDALVASALLNEISPHHPWTSLYRAYSGDLPSAFKTSHNGQRLLELGLEKDISWCLQKDFYPVIVKQNQGGFLVKEL